MRHHAPPTPSWLGGLRPVEGAEDSPTGFLPWEVPASRHWLARSSLNMERRSASRRVWHSSSSRPHEEDVSVSPLVG
jgi:hypothetical protein